MREFSILHEGTNVKEIVRMGDTHIQYFVMVGEEQVFHREVPFKGRNSMKMRQVAAREQEWAALQWVEKTKPQPGQGDQNVRSI